MRRRMVVVVPALATLAAWYGDPTSPRGRARPSVADPPKILKDINSIADATPRKDEESAATDAVRASGNGRTGSSYPSAWKTVGTSTYFIAAAADSGVAGGRAVYRTDGTSRGTHMLQGLDPGSVCDQLTVVGTKLYFRVRTASGSKVREVLRSRTEEVQAIRRPVLGITGVWLQH